MEENILGFVSILCTSIVANGLKVQIAVSMQLQGALHDPIRGIRVISSKSICNFLKKNKNKMNILLTTNAGLTLAL